MCGTIGPAVRESRKNVKIEMYEARDGASLPSGRPELWVRVLSDKLTTLPQVIEQLDLEQVRLLAQYERATAAWRPEDDTEGHKFGDYWIFKKAV